MHVHTVAQNQSRSPVQFTTFSAAVAAGAAAPLGGHSTPLSPVSPASLSGPSVFNAHAAGEVSSEIDGTDSARIGTNPVLSASDGTAVPDSVYRGHHDEVSEEAFGRLYHTIGTPMHASALPQSHMHVKHGLHKRAVSDFDFSYMPFAQDRNVTGGIGQQPWLRGDNGGERDISEEFDVTMVLGDLNYRFVVAAYWCD